MSAKGPPRTPEEMDALLAELRADPAKAARFRADLMEKTRNAFAKLGKLESPLHQLISEAFSFLVHEYGFTEHAEKMVGRFGATTLKEYSNSMNTGRRIRPAELCALDVKRPLTCG